MLKSISEFSYRALVRSIGEILSLCGSKRRVVIATLNVLGHENKSSKDGPGGEVSHLLLLAAMLLFAPFMLQSADGCFKHFLDRTILPIDIS